MITNNLPKVFILAQLSNCSCNLRCPYCYITSRKLWSQTSANFFQYPIEHMLKGFLPERLGGIALINLTGLGETFLQDGVVELIRGLLAEGHFIEVVTNGTVKKRIYEVLQIPEEDLERLEFKISYHYQELKRQKLIDSFFETVKAIKKSKASFTLELMPYDELEKDIQDIINLTIKQVGAKPQVTVGRDDAYKNRRLLTKHSEEKYMDTWSVFQSPMFNFKMSIINKRNRGFCYAGKWSFFVDLNTGDAFPCYGQPSNQNIFKNLDKPIKYEPVGYYCTEPYCINGHAHLTMGLKPNIETPTFAEIRNRVAQDGSEWMKERCQKGFRTKLFTTNETLNKRKKFIYTISYPCKVIMWCLKNPKVNFSKMKRFLKLKQ